MCVCICVSAYIMVCFHVCLASVNYESKGCKSLCLQCPLPTSTRTSIRTPLTLTCESKPMQKPTASQHTQPWLLNDCHPSLCHIIN